MKNNYEILIYAVIISIVFGLGTSLFFLIINQTSYSAIYIIPGSIIHESESNSVLFTYGVKSSESGRMDYTLEVYRDKILIKTRQFTLNKGELLDERDKITLPDYVEYPTKISLILTTKASKEEVHFWLKK